MCWVGIPYYCASINFPIDDKAKNYPTSYTTIFHKANYYKCYAVLMPTEKPLKERFFELELTEDSCFELELTEDNLDDFSFNYSILEFVIFPEDYSFIILWVEEYYILAGEKDFIENLIGCDIGTAINIFKKDANSRWTNYGRESCKDFISMLMSIYEKYKAHNEKVLKALGSTES